MNANTTLFLSILMGLFFSISGFHKLFVPARHKMLVETLKACGVPFLRFNSWFVPSVEFSAGLGMIALPFLSLLSFPFAFELHMLACLGLLCICSVACGTDGMKRIKEWQPIDKADAIDDFLYLPETLYIIVLLAIMFNLAR